MKLYRFSPISWYEDLLKAIEHTHIQCNTLCFQSYGEYFPNAWNIGIFCHYEDEFLQLKNIQKEIVTPSDSPNQKYFKLKENIVFPEINGIPQTTYTHLYIRRPDPYRHHVWDVDFYLSNEEYLKRKTYLLEWNTIQWARVFDRTDLDMIELHHPDIDALWYISTEQMTQDVHEKLSEETNL